MRPGLANQVRAYSRCVDQDVTDLAACFDCSQPVKLQARFALARAVRPHPATGLSVAVELGPDAWGHM